MSTSIEYPGYQFYAVLRFEGHTASECLRYAALTVQGWLCERILKADGTVPEEIRCVPADCFMDIPSSDLKSIKLPFSEIISLPNEGIWTLMVREPDPAIAARSYITHVGLKAGKENVEFGVYTDVVDRDRTLPELDKAFRPQFVRLLFETEGMTLLQVEPLTFRQIIKVSDKRGVAKLKALADDRDNQLPLIVFTHAKQAQATVSEMEQFMAEMMKGPAMPRLGLPPITTPSAAVQKKPSHAMPYDAEEFAKHIYGFARAYIATPEVFTELRAKFNKARLNEGDILVVEPKAFRGSVKVHSYRAGLNPSWYKGVTEDLTQSLQCYSKHKPYCYGTILFADDARQLMREEVYDVMNTIANTPKEIETEIGKVFVRIHGVRGCNPFWKGSLDTYLNHNTSITSAAFAQIAFVEKDFGFSITIILASLGIKLIKISSTNLQKAKNAKANTRIILKTNAGLRIALKKADARIHEVYTMISNLSDKNEKLLSFRNADYRNLSDDDKKWLWNMHINTTALLEIIKDNVLL